LTIQQQCELLGLPRSTYYYEPRPESAENLRLLRRLDELYLEYPFFGSRRMAVTLEVNRKRIQRLMRILEIEALYPKPNLSRPAAATKSTRTCCAASRSSGPTKSGAPILRTFRCRVAFSTWSR
jgi:putative transposase